MYKIANTNDASQPVTTTPLEATHADFFGDETELDVSNITNTYLVPTTLNTRIHKDHSLDYVIRDVQSIEPKKVIQALTDPTWIEAMQNELLQFKLQKGYTQEEGIDYDEVFAPVARIEAISFHSLSSFKDLLYTRWIIKSDILLVQVYVDDIIFGSNKKELCTAYEKLMHKKFQMSSMGELTFFIGLQVTQKDDGISSFGQDSPFDLEAYTDSDYAGASLDRKSTTGGCQFLGRRLISWQCKKQTIVANSTTKAEYVAASTCL
ncbi:copia protein [Tanacetum coccineum]